MRRLPATSTRSGGSNLSRSSATSLPLPPRRVARLLFVLSGLLGGDGAAPPSRRALAGARRGLDQGPDRDVVLDLAGYSVKFERCHAPGDGRRLEDWEEGREESQEEVRRGSFVTFRFCDTAIGNPVSGDDNSEGAPSCESCRDSGHGELSLDLMQYIEIATDHHRIDTMTENGYLDAADFADCVPLVEFDDDAVDDAAPAVVYAGPACAADGTRIEIGLFVDRECTVPAEGDLDAYLTDDGAARFSYALLGKTDGRDAGACVARCRDDQDESPTPPVCEVLYFAGLAEDYYEDYYHEEDHRGDDSIDDDDLAHDQGDDEAFYVAHEDVHDDGGSCTYRAPDGTYYAGRFCEFAATSVCPPGAGEGGGEMPHFCTNAGRCHSRIAYTDAGDREEESGCVCPDGFYGEYCELVWEAAFDLDGEEGFVEEEQQQQQPPPGAWGNTFEDDDPLYFSDEDNLALHVDESLNYTVRERNALANFHRITQGSRWGASDLWLSDEASVCEWHGVGCNEDRSVTSLELGRNLIVGDIAEIGLFTLRQLGNLSTLNLEHNFLHGTLSYECGYHLQSLTHLKLGYNDMKGSIPESLSIIPQLETLELQENSFSWAVMNTGYSSLRHLSLRNNHISGTVPYDLARLHGLEYVSLEMNRFSGCLPRYSLLENLISFDISHNAISGTLPLFSENLKLQHLNVSHNNLIGVIEQGTLKGAFDQSPGPFVLDLGFNMFEGTLPNFEVDVLNVNVIGNTLDGIDPAACDHDLWNNDATSRFGCNGIACPSGTSNAEGRQTSEDQPCEPCAIASHYGTVGCSENIEEQDEGGHGEAGVGVVDECDFDCLNGGQSTLQPTSLPVHPYQETYLQINSPGRLFKRGGYDHRVASFGPPFFSGIANVHYAGSDFCDNEQDMIEWPSPFILMVDRGQCTFVQKVRNAQSVGAQAVVIADNVCLCDAGDACESAPDQACEKEWPILADDGSGRDIDTPSFLILKQDADPIKNALQANIEVVMELALSLVETVESSVVEGTSDPSATVPDLPAKPSPAPSVQTPSPTAEATPDDTETIISGQYAVPRWQSSLVSFLSLLVFSAFGSFF